MNAFAEVILLGWIPLIGVLFVLLPPARATLIAMIAGWYFLPVARLPIQGFVDYDKVAATALAPFLCALTFGFAHVRRVRPHPVDFAVLALCFLPYVSSIANGVSGYTGMSASLRELIRYGFPYFLGRLYFSDRIGRRELCFGIVIGGLAYVLPCLYEVRMSPQLHAMVYGDHQHSFSQTKRFGGFRPMVFMTHGLAVALAMMLASLVAVVLWQSRRLHSILFVPIGLAVALLLATTVLCKSLGAAVLLALGLAILVEDRWLRTRFAATLALLFPLLYLGSRITGTFPSEWLVARVAEIVPDRAQSLGFRIENEDLLIDSKEGKLALGSGPLGFKLVEDEEGRVRDLASDSMWIIMLSKYGLLSVLALYTMLIAPTWLVLRRVPRGALCEAPYAPAAALALTSILATLDTLVNSMLSPVNVLVLGALTAGLGVTTAVRAAPSLAERGPGGRSSRPLVAQPHS